MQLQLQLLCPQVDRSTRLCFVLALPHNYTHNSGGAAPRLFHPTPPHATSPVPTCGSRSSAAVTPSAASA